MDKKKLRATISDVQGTEEYQNMTNSLINSRATPDPLKQENEVAIFYEPLNFSKKSECIKIPVNNLGIANLNTIQHYSVTFNVTLNTNFNKLEGENTFFYIGSNTLHKSLEFGLSRDKVFFLTCKNIKNKAETCYTQRQLKNKKYHITIVITTNPQYSQMDLYIDGTNEASISFKSSMEPVQGDFCFGSEDPMRGFYGIISDAIFFSKELIKNEVKKVYETAVLTKSQEPAIEVMKKEKQFLLATEYEAKTKGVPLMLVRTHNFEKNLTLSEIEDKNQDTLMQTETDDRNVYVILTEKLKLYLSKREMIFNLLRDVGLNTDWIFKVCLALSPVIESQGNPSKYNFQSLNYALAESKKARYYPCYAITVDSFMRVLQKAGCKIPRNEIIQIADELKSFDGTKGYEEFIYYDRVLIAIRNSCLTHEEMFDIHNIADPENENNKNFMRLEEGKFDLIPNHTPNEASKVEEFNHLEFVRANQNCELRSIYVFSDHELEGIVGLQFVFELENGEKQYFEHGKVMFDDNLKVFPVETVMGDINLGLTLRSSGSGTYRIKVMHFQIYNGQEVETKIAGDANGAIDLFQSKFLINPEESDRKKITGFYGCFVDGYLTSFGVNYQTLVEEPEAEPIDIELHLPELVSDWNAGKFQLIINHWDSIYEKPNSYINPNEFIQMFNRWGDRIKEVFPNADIIGNYEKPYIFAMFEVYIRGIGPITDRIENDKIVLYQNFGSKEYRKTLAETIETLIVYSFEYGDSNELAKAQELYFVRNESNLPLRWEKSHSHPYIVEANSPVHVRSKSKEKKAPKANPKT